MEPLYWMLFIGYASYAYNRKSVVFSMPMLKAEGLDASYAGLIVSSQNVAFSISKFIAGILSDYLNPNVLFSIGLLASGSATLLFASSFCVTDFCAFWFLNGLAQGCGWPACAKILSQRAPPSEFGTLWSFLSCSANFSGTLGPILSAFIIVHFGWRWNVFIAGLLTLSILAVFLFTLPFLTDAQQVKSEEKNQSNSDEEEEQASLLGLFRDPFIWLLSLLAFIVFCARTTTIDWGQLYLIEENNHSQYVASAFISSVEIGGFTGRMLAGFLTDWLIQKGLNDTEQKSPHWKPLLRMSVALVFMVGSFVSLHLFRFSITEKSSSVWIILIGAMMGMGYYGSVNIFEIVSAESVSPHLSGASHAIVALFENIGATVSGLPLSYIAKYYNWSSVFFLLEILVAVALYLMIRYRTLTPKVQKVKEVKEE